MIVRNRPARAWSASGGTGLLRLRFRLLCCRIPHADL